MLHKQKFENLYHKQKLLKEKAQSDKLYKQVKQVYNLFIKHDLSTGDPWSWTIMNDWIVAAEYGVISKGQHSKIVELLIKYGESSDFWKELQRTKRQRTRDMRRMYNAVIITLQVMKEGGLKRNQRRVLSGFLLKSIDFRKKLLMNPLTENQKKDMFRVERILGIYYSDLSPLENGIVIERKARKDE